MIPDYLALENAMQRHQDAIRERENDRLVAEIVSERKRGASWLARMWQFFVRQVRNVFPSPLSTKSIPVTQAALGSATHCADGQCAS
ncbi:MAG: hypothetical protein R3E39_11700 [Anaerolineae bacterium]